MVCSKITQHISHVLLCSGTFLLLASLREDFEYSCSYSCLVSLWIYDDENKTNIWFTEKTFLWVWVVTWKDVFWFVWLREMTLKCWTSHYTLHILNLQVLIGHTEMSFSLRWYVSNWFMLQCIKAMLSLLIMRRNQHNCRSVMEKRWWRTSFMVQETRSIGSVRFRLRSRDFSFVTVFGITLWFCFVFLALLCTAYIETATSWFAKWANEQREALYLDTQSP